MTRANAMLESAHGDGHLLDVSGRLSAADTDGRSAGSDGVSVPSTLLHPRAELLALQHDQPCIGRQYFADRILKFPSSLDAAADFFDFIRRNMLDALLTIQH